MDFITDEQPEYNISLRVVRIEITDGCFENIITNLPDMEFDIENFTSSLSKQHLRCLF